MEDNNVSNGVCNHQGHKFSCTGDGMILCSQCGRFEKLQAESEPTEKRGFWGRLWEAQWGPTNGM